MKIKYPKGTPCPSHEYYRDVFGEKYGVINERGFLVGCHSENVSTHFNHPFKGECVGADVLRDFGLYNVPLLKLRFSFRKWIFRKMPHSIRRKMRYLSEKLYNYIRS